jgi:ATP-dependent exoDNAse (exonuclease V) alpha subunit
VFGVAPSAIAASVLTTETGVRADTIDKLLAEHQTGHPKPTFDLPAGTTVIVDEAGMLATAKLAELIRLAEDRSWRVALVGDPFQFSAVGRGGMFGMIIDTHGGIELDRVHRFTNNWERTASLQLRRGDPTVADTYEREGRLHGGNVEQIERAAVSAWWRHRTAGESTLLMAPSNDTVDRLNQAAQQRRIRAGEIGTGEWLEYPNGLRLHVGDEIATRRNDRTIETDRHEMVATATPGPSPQSTTTGPSPPAEQPAPSPSPPPTCATTSNSPTPSPQWAHKAAPSTTPSPSSTRSPTSATSTSP